MCYFCASQIISVEQVGSSLSNKGTINESILKFKPLADTDIIEALAEKGVEGEKAKSLAHLASGNLNQAYTLMEDAENDNALLFLEWLRILPNGASTSVQGRLEHFQICNEFIQGWVGIFPKVVRNTS